jgi:hypothetical protein
MRRTRKLFMVSVLCAGIAMALLLITVLTTRLLANREQVKSLIVSKTAQATGGTLDYDRLNVSLFPLPHLRARNVHLHRPQTFDVAARELSVYPRFLPILKGRVSIRQIVLVSPDLMIPVGSGPARPAVSPASEEHRSLQGRPGKAIDVFFGALKAIDPQTDLRIEDGAVTLWFTDAPDLRIGGIDARVENEDDGLSLTLDGRSDLTGRLTFSASVDIDAMQARGQATLSGMNLRPLLFYGALPGGITAEDTRAAATATFAVDGPETVNGRFDLRFPSLTVKRNGRTLDLEGVAVSGSMAYAGQRLSVAVDTLRSAKPALELTGAASIRPRSAPGGSVVEVRAAMDKLDIASAGALTRAVAGDLAAIRTAFSVARAGQLTDVAFYAGFETGSNGLQLTGMKASGHLAQGLVTIPGIETDLERMDGDVLYEDNHVAFKNVSGYIRGATFKGLDAAIDWEKESTLAISTRSVAVDTGPMYDWLTGFKGLDKFKDNVETLSGTARIHELDINGPLTEPEKWIFRIAGAPETLLATSPLVPFEVKLSGGEIIYTPGKEQAKGVRIDFLDGFIVASYQAKGIIVEESSVWRIDGSMGQAAIDWAGTVLPIPSHLQIKPPVELYDVKVEFNTTDTFSFTGGLKTGGGVDVRADFTVAPQDWQFRRIQFADGSSRATVSVRKNTHGIAIGFSGNVEKNTADRLLADNRVLSGRLEGEFQTEINRRQPLNSSFSGTLAGRGVHIIRLFPEPFDLNHFSIDGRDGVLKIGSSEVSLCNSLMVVDGVLERSDGDLIVDLNVDADRLDEQLIRALRPIGSGNADGAGKPAVPSTTAPRGAVHIQAANVTYGGMTWSPVQASVRLDGDNTRIQIDQADLCGISTTGMVEISPRGVGLRITPTATDASLQQTVDCLWHRPIQASSRYDLSGEIHLPPTKEDPAAFLSGQMEFSSLNGRIESDYVLMKIFSVLNITEVFTGGKSDLAEKGYGYTKAYASAEIGEGKLTFNEILLDGNSLKITGQGNIDLGTNTVDIILLAAPLKTIDRIVNKIPIIGYIMGGSLISVPLGVKGKMGDLSVVPLPPSAVGKGLLGIMERTLKAPFKLVESAAEFVSEESAASQAAPAPPTEQAPGQ